MITAIRRIQFCAGHRVYKHESKCANMHGHNYVAHIEVETSFERDPLDSIGRVIDFSVIKDKIGSWIETYWDHGFLYFKEDEDLRLLFQVGGVLDGHKSFMLEYNPTAENMAYYLLSVIGPTLLNHLGVRIVSVRLEETENCSVKVGE